MGRRAWAIGVVTAAILAAGSGSSASATIVGPPVADPSAVAFQTLLLGRSDEAHEHFERALRASMSTTSLAETQLEVGRLLLQRGDPRARGLISAAQEDARRCGLGWLAERAHSTLALTG